MPCLGLGWGGEGGSVSVCGGGGGICSGPCAACSRVHISEGSLFGSRVCVLAWLYHCGSVSRRRLSLDDPPPVTKHLTLP